MRILPTTALPTIIDIDFLSFYQVEHVLERRPDSFYDSDSIRNSVGSFRDSESNRDSMGDRDWEEYSSQLKEVLSWLSKAEAKLKSQPAVSRNVDTVKDQFHEHEVSIQLFQKKVEGFTIRQHQHKLANHD